MPYYAPQLGASYDTFGYATSQSSVAIPDLYVAVRFKVNSKQGEVMKISIDQPKAGVQQINLDGRLDVAGTQSVESEFNAAVSKGSNVVVDLAKVPFIASLGIRLLVSGAQTLSKKGGKMVLMNPDELTRKILKTTGIDQLVPVCNGLDEALSKI